MCEVPGANQLPFFNLPTVHPFTHWKRVILLSVAPSTNDAVDAIKRGQVKRLCPLFARDPAECSWRVSSVDIGWDGFVLDADILYIFYCSQ